MKKATLTAAVFGAVLAVPFAFAGNLVSPFDGTIGTEHTIDAGDTELPAKPKIILTFDGVDEAKAKDPKAKAKFLSKEGNNVNFIVQTAKGNGFFNVDFKGVGEPGLGAFGTIRVNPPNLDRHVNFLEATPGDEVTLQGTYFGSKKPKVFVNGKKAKTLTFTQNSVDIRLHKKTPGGADSVTIVTKTGEDTMNGALTVIAPVGGKSQLAYTAGGFKIVQKHKKNSPVIAQLAPGNRVNVGAGGAAAKPKGNLLQFEFAMGAPIGDIGLPATFDVTAAMYTRLLLNGRVPQPQSFSTALGGGLSITINAYDGTRIAGTFEGTLANVGGAGPANIDLTGGTFALELLQP